MSSDKYRPLREMPFPVIAQALSIDLSKFKQRKGGSEWSGPCPVHGGKKSNTAFSYSADGKWHCFSCDHKGRGAIDLAMAIRNIRFQAAVEVLEPFAGASALLASSNSQQAKGPMKRSESAPLLTENPPFKSSYEKFFRPHPWLAERGLKPETLERYGVGFYQNDTRRSAYNGSVMLKIRRWSGGECVGYLSRNIGEITPERGKYRFPEGLHKSLEVWGAFELKEDHALPLRVIYLVESPFSVMKFHQLGLPCIAVYGWSVGQQQADIIAQVAKGVVCLPDRNKHQEFGPSAFLLSQKMWVKTPEMPDGVEDPEHLSLEQIKALT